MKLLSCSIFLACLFVILGPMIRTPGQVMKRITTILCICCLPIAAQESQIVSQKVLFENPIVRVIELGNNNKLLQPARYPSLLMMLDSIKPAKWSFAWEASDSARTLAPESRHASNRG